MPKFAVTLRREETIYVDGESREEVQTFFDDLSQSDFSEWLGEWPDSDVHVYKFDGAAECEFKMHDGKCMSLSDIPIVVPDLGLEWLKDLTIKGDRFHKPSRITMMDGPHIVWTNGHWLVFGPDADVPTESLDTMDAKTAKPRAEFLRERLRQAAVLDGRLMIGPGHFDNKYLREAAQRCDGETLRAYPLVGDGSHFGANPEHDPIAIMGETVTVVIMPLYPGSTPAAKFCEWSKT